MLVPLIALSLLSSADPPPVVRTSVTWEAGSRLDYRAFVGEQLHGAISLGPAQVRRGSRGLSVGRSGQAIEELVERGARVELRWRFDAAPAGSGDLEVRVPVVGPTFAGLSPAGVHFVDPATMRYFSVSHGVWVEAGGRRHALAARFDGTAVVYSVEAKVLAATRWPAVLDPVVTPEVSFGVPALGPATESQTEPRLASDGLSSFAVWTDTRGGQTGGNEVWGALLDSTGAPVPGTETPIAIGLWDEYAPAVAYGQNRYLVVWYDSSNGGVAGRLFAQDGKPLGPRFAISSRNGHHLAIAFDGAAFMVVWKEYASTTDYDIHVKEVSVTGGVGPDVVVCDQAAGQFQPSIACDAARQCLVAWEDDRDYATNETDLYAARLNAGLVVDPNGAPIEQGPGRQYYPTVAASGSGFLVGWTDEDSGDAAARLVDGATLAVGPKLPVADAASVTERSLQLAPFDTGFLAIFELGGRIKARRLDAAGAAIDATPADVCSVSVSAMAQPSVTPVSGGALVAWADARGADSTVYAARISTPFTLPGSEGNAVPRSAESQSEVRVASDGQRYLAAWLTRPPSGPPRVEGAFVDALGRQQGAALFTFSDPQAAGQAPKRGPRVAALNGTFLVVWIAQPSSGKPTVFARTLRPDGSLGEAAPFMLADPAAPDEDTPEVGAAGNQFLVAWDSDGQVWGTRVAESGAKIDAAPFLIASEADDEDTFAVAGQGSGFVVAWHRERTSSISLHLGRVAADGQTPDGPNGVEVTDPTESHYTPALACQATGCVVTWERSGQILGRAYGPTLTPTGPAFTVSGAASLQRLPTMVWDGARYLVAWEDSRSGLAVEAWATELEVDGTVRAPAGRLLVSPPYSLRGPSLAAAGPGQALLAYTVFDAAPQVQGNRVRAVAVLDLPNGEACSAPGQCTSGHCTDGVCCDAACGGGTVDCEACSAAKGASANGVCTLLGLGASCRSSVGACDFAESCDGVSKSCPSDAWGPDGAPCNIDGACAAGVCIGGAAAVPGFVSTPGVFLTCSETFRYDGDGLPEVSGPGTPSFSLAPFPGSALPEGLTIDAVTGALAWVPSAEQAGVHKVVLVVRGDGWAAGQVLELNVECEKRQLSVSCAHAPGGLGALGLVLLAALRRRPKAGRSRSSR